MRRKNATGNIAVLAVLASTISSCSDEKVSAALDGAIDRPSTTTEGPQSPLLTVSSQELDFGKNDSSRSFNITSSNSNLGFTVTTPGDWIQTSPSSGTLINGSAAINVTIDREKLGQKKHHGKITVSTGIKSIDIDINIDNRDFRASEKFSSETKLVAGYKFEPGICELTGGELNCRIKISNTSGSGPLTIYSGRYKGPYSNTRLIKDGKDYGGYAVTFAGNTGGKEITGFLLTDVPLEASIKFTSIPSNLTEFDIFEVKFRNGRSYSGDFFSVLWKPVYIANRN